MVLTPDVVLLNPLKHHAGALKQFLETVPDDKTVYRELLRIGQSQMDFYYGALAVETIAAEAIQELEQQQISSSEAFTLWLRPAGFREFTGSDGTTWIFREGQGAQFVHLHPGRYAAHTIRIKASTLKTAALVFRQIRLHNLPWPAPREVINALRMSGLNLPPIGTHDGLKQVERAVNLLLQ